MKTDGLVIFLFVVVGFIALSMAFPHLRGRINSLNPKRQNKGHAQKGNDSGGVLTHSAETCGVASAT
jgi:hypothetical protein